MKLLIVAAVLGMACAGRLDNTYLPPSNAASAGGAGLAGPFGGGYSSGGSFGVLAKAAPVAITKYSNENNGEGAYAYNYESADGTSAQESGSLSGPETLVSKGSYSYTAPDGTPITVNYIADENGFRAEGAHLPTPPPIPEAILRSLEVNAAAEAARARSGPAGGAGGFNGYSSGPNAQYLPPGK